MTPPPRLNNVKKTALFLQDGFPKQDQALPNHVHGKIWPRSTQFWLRILGFSSILKVISFETPCKCIECIPTLDISYEKSNISSKKGVKVLQQCIAIDCKRHPSVWGGCSTLAVSLLITRPPPKFKPSPLL